MHSISIGTTTNPRTLSDETYWEELFKRVDEEKKSGNSRYRFDTPTQLPNKDTPCSDTSFAEKALVDTELTAETIFGLTLMELAKRNPSWPARAIVGLIYEAKEQDI